jgi:hypothetical protein
MLVRGTSGRSLDQENQRYNLAIRVLSWHQLESKALILRKSAVAGFRCAVAPMIAALTISAASAMIGHTLSVGAEGSLAILLAYANNPPKLFPVSSQDRER